MKEFRTMYLHDVVEVIEEDDINTIIVRGKEFVRVVRCKDCKYYLMWSDIPDQYGDSYTYLSCLFWVTDNDILPSVKPNDFCSYGELKNGENT